MMNPFDGAFSVKLGMTTRAYIATHLLAGYLVDRQRYTQEKLPALAVEMADKLIAELNK